MARDRERILSFIKTKTAKVNFYFGGFFFFI